MLDAVYWRVIVKVHQLRAEAAVRRAEPTRPRFSTRHTKQFGSEAALLPSWPWQDPYALDRRRLSQVVNMPASSLRRPEVSADARL